MSQPLNIGMIGYGFMGRAHSNAYANVNHYFDLPRKVVLKAVCARDGEKAKEFAAKWGYESVETDWKKLLERKPSPRDRRVIFAELTPQGRELLAAIFPPHAEKIRAAVTGLTLEEQVEAIRLLKKLGLAAQDSY